MADFPTSIKVGPFHYRVVEDADLVGRDRCGEIRYGTLTIALSPNTAPDRQAETLLHEVLHAVWEIGLDVVSEPKHNTETVIERLSPHLLSVLRDNPDLVAYLVGG